MRILGDRDCVMCCAGSVPVQYEQAYLWLSASEGLLWGKKVIKAKIPSESSLHRLLRLIRDNTVRRCLEAPFHMLRIIIT